MRFSTRFQSFLSRAAILCAAAAVTVVLQARAADPVYWIDRAGNAVPEPDVIAAARGADYVQLGEIHDNPTHHRAQARLLDAILAAGRRPALVWEMVRRDQAPALAAATDADDFARRLDWANSGWPDFGMYRPLVALAYAHDLRQVAGNLPTEVVGALSRSGLAILGAGTLGAWGLAPAPNETVRAVQLDAVFDGHCALIPKERLATMVDVQLARDAALAAAMVDNRTAGGAVLIAGSGHVRTDVAVPYFLRRLDPDARILAIGQWEAATAAERTAGPFDITGFAAPVDRPDPCERMRAFMENATPTE